MLYYGIDEKSVTSKLTYLYWQRMEAAHDKLRRILPEEHWDALVNNEPTLLFQEAAKAMEDEPNLAELQLALQDYHTARDAFDMCCSARRNLKPKRHEPPLLGNVEAILRSIQEEREPRIRDFLGRRNYKPVNVAWRPVTNVNDLANIGTDYRDWQQYVYASRRSENLMPGRSFILFGMWTLGAVPISPTGIEADAAWSAVWMRRGRDYAFTERGIIAHRGHIWVHARDAEHARRLLDRRCKFGPPKAMRVVTIADGTAEGFCHSGCSAWLYRYFPQYRDTFGGADRGTHPVDQGV